MSRLQMQRGGVGYLCVASVAESQSAMPCEFTVYLCVASAVESQSAVLCEFTVYLCLHRDAVPQSP